MISPCPGSWWNWRSISSEAAAASVPGAFSRLWAVAVDLPEEALAAVDAQAGKSGIRRRVVGESGSLTGQHVACAGDAAGEYDENPPVRVERLGAGGEVGDQLPFVGQPGLSGRLVVSWRDRVGAKLYFPAVLAEDRGHPIGEDLGGLAARQIEAVGDRRGSRPGVTCGDRPRTDHKDSDRQRRHPERVMRSAAIERPQSVHEILPASWRGRHSGAFVASSMVRRNCARLTTVVNWTVAQAEPLRTAASSARTRRRRSGPSVYVRPDGGSIRAAIARARSAAYGVTAPFCGTTTAPTRLNTNDHGLERSGRGSSRKSSTLWGRGRTPPAEGPRFS